MTSIVTLQRALDQCGLEVIGSSKLLDSLATARAAVDAAATSEERIAALEELVKVIQKCNQHSSLPTSINLGGVTLSLNNYRYVISGTGSQSAPDSVKNAVDKLNDAYRRAAAELVSEESEAIGEILSERERQVVIAAIRAERESYLESVQDAKDEIFRTIQENARKEGFAVKRNTFSKGKHAGREQYVVVSRR